MDFNVFFYRSIEKDLQNMDVTSSDIQKLHQQVTAIVQVISFFMLSAHIYL